MTRPLVIVAAVADNGVIGRDNQLIWRLRSDLRRFREITWGKPLVMGRKTFESIGRPLPGRQSVVLTRDATWRAEGAHVAASLPEGLALADRLAHDMGADEIVVAGGGEVYRQALPVADRIRLTRVHARPEGDATFPEIDESQFAVTAQDEHPAGEGDEFPFVFLDLERRKPLSG